MLSFCLLGLTLAAPEVARFDLTQAAAVAQWAPTHDIGGLTATPDGMVIAITGGDPYTVGPARDYPPGQPLWLRLRLRSEAGGGGQVFFGARGFTEEASVRFAVAAGAWAEVSLALPPLGPGCRLRFDAPGASGTCTLAWLALEPRHSYTPPAWPKPAVPALDARALSLTAGELTLRHAPDRLGAFTLDAGGQPVAVGQTRPLIGYLQGDAPRWLDLGAAAKTIARRDGDGLLVEASATDADGATWRLSQRFTPRGKEIDVTTQVAVSADREVLYLPVVTVFPGLGSFGARRNQGLFCGLEYLDEPDTSSSEADIIGPGAQRQVPDNLKITVPLMVVQAAGRWVALSWRPERRVAALYDTPDRQFGSGAAVMGLLVPGSDGGNREEGKLLPYRPERLAASQPLVVEATLGGGAGADVVPAVQAWVARWGLPPRPAFDVPGYVAQTAAGWLDAGVREGDRFRHAYWPGHTGFGPQATADAPVFMAWLATRTPDAALAERLRTAAAEALARVPSANWLDARVSHVAWPVTPLVHGHVDQLHAQALRRGRGPLKRFAADGTVRYVARAGGEDYGRTHFAKDANGLTAQVVAVVLESAALTRDAELVREGLRVLRALDKFDHSVPRGAQTWECALHTPDILASAHLVKAYTLGYELTGDPALLDRARYWAWTGVPFVYLVNPTTQPVGPYATIAVLGATNWRAPNWMGLPVQWCGLVYAAALQRLARHDPQAIWSRLADGIAVSGAQQSWPLGQGKLTGLLPDSFAPRSQSRNPVAINPGTVQAPAIAACGGPLLYDYHLDRTNQWAVHVAGELRDVRESAGRLEFGVRGWTPAPWHLLIAGSGPVTVTLDGRPAPVTAGEGWSTVLVPAGTVGVKVSRG